MADTDPINEADEVLESIHEDLDWVVENGNDAHGWSHAACLDNVFYLAGKLEKLVERDWVAREDAQQLTRRMREIVEHQH